VQISGAGSFPSWSISVEFAAYLTFPLICMGLAKYRQTTLALLSILTLPGLMIGRDDWERTALFHGLPMFFIGVLIFYIRPKWTAQTLATLQIVSAISLACIMHFGLPDVFSVPCFAVLIFSTQSDIGPARLLLTKPLHTLGDWSYSIYMLHIPVRIVTSILFAAKLSPSLFFVVILVSTLALGAASYRFFEMPIRRAIMSTPPRAILA
jgi:peptidoglycan/LPS O-acetylase OafA/YrhL